MKPDRLILKKRLKRSTQIYLTVHFERTMHFAVLGVQIFLL